MAKPKPLLPAVQIQYYKVADGDALRGVDTEISRNAEQIQG